MKKVFLDIGFNKGQSVNHFIDIVPDYKEYEIHIFEPDKRNFPHIEKYCNKYSNIVPHRDVVYTYDGIIKFYYARASYGNTVVLEKTTGNISKGNFKELPCIDLAKFLIKNFTLDDYIILKMDIEGAEYKVIQHLIEADVIKYVDDLFVEFHGGKLRKPYLKKNEHENLINKIYNLGFNNCKSWEKEFIVLEDIERYYNKNI